MKDNNIAWTLTGIYGPQGDQEKLAFLEELKGLKERSHQEWLIIGFLT